MVLVVKTQAKTKEIKMIIFNVAVLNVFCGGIRK